MSQVCSARLVKVLKQVVSEEYVRGGIDGRAWCTLLEALERVEEILRRVRTCKAVKL